MDSILMASHLKLFIIRNYLHLIKKKRKKTKENHWKLYEAIKNRPHTFHKTKSDATDVIKVNTNIHAPSHTSFGTIY